MTKAKPLRLTAKQTKDLEIAGGVLGGIALLAAIAATGGAAAVLAPELIGGLIGVEGGTVAAAGATIGSVAGTTAAVTGAASSAFAVTTSDSAYNYAKQSGSATAIRQAKENLIMNAAGLGLSAIDLGGIAAGARDLTTVARLAGSVGIAGGIGLSAAQMTLGIRNHNTGEIISAAIGIGLAGGGLGAMIGGRSSAVSDAVEDSGANLGSTNRVPRVDTQIYTVATRIRRMSIQEEQPIRQSFDENGQISEEGLPISHPHDSGRNYPFAKVVSSSFDINALTGRSTITALDNPQFSDNIPVAEVVANVRYVQVQSYVDVETEKIVNNFRLLYGIQRQYS